MSSPIGALRNLSRLPAYLSVGAALIETTIAMAIVAIFLTGEYAASARVWGMLRSSLEANAGSRVLNGRAELIRASTWDQITDADFLNTSVLSVAPDAAGELSALTETIDVTAYPVPSPSPSPLQIVRNNDTGVVTTTKGGDGKMPDQISILINVTANWTAKGGQPRTKQMSLIISNGGITGRH